MLLKFIKMAKKCAVCNKGIEERFGKLKGASIKVLEDNKNRFIYVCCECQKQEDWIEKAKIKAA